MRLLTKVLDIVRPRIQSAIASMLMCPFQNDITEFHLFGERLFNKEGLYETQVDHLREIMRGMYHQDTAPWQIQLRNFQNITSLSVSLPAITPKCEYSGKDHELTTSSALASTTPSFFSKVKSRSRTASCVASARWP